MRSYKDFPSEDIFIILLKMIMPLFMNSDRNSCSDPDENAKNESLSRLLSFSLFGKNRGKRKELVKSCYL